MSPALAFGKSSPRGTGDPRRDGFYESLRTTSALTGSGGPRYRRPRLARPQAQRRCSGDPRWECILREKVRASPPQHMRFPGGEGLLPARRTSSPTKFAAPSVGHFPTVPIFGGSAIQAARLLVRGSPRSAVQPAYRTGLLLLCRLERRDWIAAHCNTWRCGRLSS